MIREDHSVKLFFGVLIILCFSAKLQIVFLEKKTSMGRGKRLTPGEISKIETLSEEGYSGRQIAEKTGRSANVIWNFLRNKENYGRNQKGGVKTATTERERRNIVRIASNSAMTARRIGEEAGSSASVWTVRRVLKASSILKRLRLKKKPLLTQRHQEARLQFARYHMNWTTEWRKVIFSDEKRFNLDGPDGASYYFHDIRKEKKYLSRRHSRSGSIMVWGRFLFTDLSTLLF